MLDSKFIIQSLTNRIDSILCQTNMLIEKDEDSIISLCTTLSGSESTIEFNIVYTNNLEIPFIVSRKYFNEVNGHYLPLTNNKDICLYCIYDTLHPYEEGVISICKPKAIEKVATNESTLDYATYGLPNEKLFPLNNKQEVIEAIKHFKYCPEGKMKELSININNIIDDFNMKIPLSYTSPFYPLINQSALIKNEEENNDMDITLENMNNTNYLWGYENELKLANQSMQTELNIPFYASSYLSHLVDYTRYFNSSTIPSVLQVVQNLYNLTYSRVERYPKLKGVMTEIPIPSIFTIKNSGKFRELFMKRNVEGYNLLFGLCEGCLYWILPVVGLTFKFIPLIRNSEITKNVDIILNTESGGNLEIVNYTRNVDRLIDEATLESTMNFDINTDEMLNHFTNIETTCENAMSLFILHESNIGDEYKPEIRTKFRSMMRELNRTEPGFDFQKYYITSPLLEFVSDESLKHPVLAKIKFTKLMR